MPEYKIQQYELHVMTYRVMARSLPEALAKLSAGGTGTDEFEYVEIPEERGALGIREVVKPDGEVLDGQDEKDKAQIIKAMQIAGITMRS